MVWRACGLHGLARSQVWPLPRYDAVHPSRGSDTHVNAHGRPNLKRASERLPAAAHQSDASVGTAARWRETTTFKRCRSAAPCAVSLGRSDWWPRSGSMVCAINWLPSLTHRDFDGTLLMARQASPCRLNRPQMSAGTSSAGSNQPPKQPHPSAPKAAGKR